MGRQTGTDIYGELVKAALQGGYPLTVREVARFADCHPTTAKAHLERMEQQQTAIRFRPVNVNRDFWMAVTSAAREKWAVVLLIAERSHRAIHCPEGHIVRGMNFIECLDCKRHAHIGPDTMKPLILHDAVEYYGPIRPEDF